MRNRLIFWSVLGVTLLSMAAFLYPRRDPQDMTQFQFIAFGRIPVLHEGRVKPLETLARTNLAMLSHRQTWRNEAESKTYPAVVWMLEVMSAEFRKAKDAPLRVSKQIDLLFQDAGQYTPDGEWIETKLTQFDVPMFRVPPTLARETSLPVSKNELYSMKQLKNALAEFKAKRRLVGNDDEAEFNREVLEELQALQKQSERFFNLDQQVIRIDSPEMLAEFKVQDLARPSFRYSLLELMGGMQNFIELTRKAGAKPKSQRDARELQALELSHPIESGLLYLTVPAKLAVVPPKTGEDWAPAASDPLGHKFLAIVQSYAENDPEKFNANLVEYLVELDRRIRGTDAAKYAAPVIIESYFNRIEPFWWGMMLYAFLFLVCAVSWIALGTGATDTFRALNRGAYWSIFAVFLMHTAGICVRMYLQGRPPVTNLYASAVFIGWGCVGLCLILESIPFFRYSIALAAGAAAGCGTLIIAHLLNRTGDNIDQLLPVLATQFWLATHVVCITIGYTTMFVAGLLGIAYIAVGLFTSAMNREGLRQFGKVIYGVVCFAMFLSFVGTVLGGIWADQSWGRFWGWDPKENGALLIVIWNAIILHARWAGMIRDRGVAVLAVGGNIITAWSWFGTNLLGVGLHSYGFMAGAFIALIAFVFTQLVIMGIGCIPLSLWRGLQPRA